MKRSRFDFRVGCTALFWKASVVYASSRTALTVNNHPTTNNNNIPSDSNFLDEDIADLFLAEQEPQAVLASTVGTQQAKQEDYDDDQWWMDPLAMFDEEDHSPDTATIEEDGNLQGFLNDNFFENDDTYSTQQAAEISKTDNDEDTFLNDDNVFEMMDDWVMDDTTPNESTSLVDQGDDDLFMELEEYGLSSTNDLDRNAHFATQDEIETALPDEPVQEKISSTFSKQSSSNSNNPAPSNTEELYDPVAPVQAPSRTSSQPHKASSFFNTPFGTNKKRPSKKQARRSIARYMDPAAGGLGRSFSPLAPIWALKKFIPQLSKIISGHPAVAALVVITLAKGAAFFNREEDPDEKLKAATIRPVKSSATRKRKSVSKRIDDKVNDGAITEDASGEPVRRVQKPVERPKWDNLERPKNSHQRGGWLRSLVKDTPVIKGAEKMPPPPKMRPQDRLEDLRRRCEQAEIEKANMEREYEKTNWELQETQIELDGLKTSTRHLQAQIMENEEVLDRIVKAERRRARDELQRMKEAMLKVVEEEREAMRSEFMKQAGELQMLMRKKQQGGSGPYTSLPASSSSHKSSRRYYDL
jgi:hypothetical protein